MVLVHLSTRARRATCRRLACKVSLTLATTAMWPRLGRQLTEIGPDSRVLELERDVARVYQACNKGNARKVKA